MKLPHIEIELYLDGEDFAILEGDFNSERRKEVGVIVKIVFDEKYQAEYEELIKGGSIKTIPIEYYVNYPDLICKRKHNN